MKLKSAVFISALKAAYKALGISVTYSEVSRITFVASAGFFLQLLEKTDTATVPDVAVLNFFKALTDETGAAEDATLQFFKVLADTGVTTDTQVISFFKALTETATTSELVIRAVAKNVFDQAGATDAIDIRSFGKVFNDQANVTDDVDGAATTQDDQEMQFFKNISEAPTATDVLTAAFTTTYAHSTSATDAGSLRSQGFSDFTYFEEDYVGASRTFT